MVTYVTAINATATTRAPAVTKNGGEPLASHVQRFTPPSIFNKRTLKVATSAEARATTFAKGPYRPRFMQHLQKFKWA
jgi:hypothetical protein